MTDHKLQLIGDKVHDPVIVAFREAMRREVFPLWVNLRRAAGLPATLEEYAAACDTARVSAARSKPPISGGT